MRTRSLITLTGLALILTACAPAAPQSAPTPSSTPAPTPTATATATATAVPEPTAGDDLTPETLANLCVDKTREFYSSDVEFFIDETRIEQRKVDPPWLVMVPTRTGGADTASVCTIGGTASAPIFEAFAAQNPLTDQEIQDAIDGVNYYEGD